MVQATQEAVANAPVGNEDMTGRDGHGSPALPRDRVAGWPRSSAPGVPALGDGTGAKPFGMTGCELRPRGRAGHALRRNALAIGPALLAPKPPPSTSTANARSPR